MTGAEAERGEFMLLTAWHVRSMRSMPRMFWLVRRLERNCRAQPGCLWVHRWVSRRSLLLTSTWRSEDDADAWLRSDAMREFDVAARALPGTQTRLERFRPA